MDLARGERSEQFGTTAVTSSSDNVMSTNEYQQLVVEMKRWKQQASTLQEEKDELTKVGNRNNSKRKNMMTSH